ncbi:MAG TPA: hypothetical protein DDX71_07390 [Ruminococcus sp.]|nr:hypothetical protein [Ruminococcus sp.]
MRPHKFMKNVLIFCAPACFLMSCSTVRSDTAFAPQLDPAYSVNAELEYGSGQSAALTLTRNSAENWEAEFSAPPALAGVLLRFDGNSVSASYKGLAFSVPKTALPAKNMLVLVTGILDKTAALDTIPCTEQSDGTWDAAGESEAGSYTLRFTADGVLHEFSVPSQPLTIRFSGYAAATAETTTAPPVTNLTTAETTNGDTSQ